MRFLSCLVRSHTFHVPIDLPSISTIGAKKADVPHANVSSAIYSSVMSTVLSSTLISSSRAISRIVFLLIPSKISLEIFGVMSVLLRTKKILAADNSQT